MAKSPVTMTAQIDDQSAAMERILGEFGGEVDAVDIGLLADEDADLVIIGAANEFGTRDGHIPERSFIRVGVDKNQAAIDKLAESIWGQILDDRMTVEDGLSRMGEEIQRHIQRWINELSFPPNAPSTIRQKARKKGRAQIRAAKKKGSAELEQVLAGFDNPLIDTRRLLNSIRWVLAKTSDGQAGI